MDKFEENDLLYRQQFIIGPSRVQGFSTWKKHEISESLFITSHPDLNIVQSSKDEASLTLIGYMLDPNEPSDNNQEILNRLITENSSASDLIRSTFELCGNWVLISKRDNELILFHDCAGARSVYYADIDKTENLWIASQPRLIAPLMGLKEDPKAIDYITSQKSKTVDYWWPGDKSPYSEIKAMLPNHYLDLRKGNTRRYWPDRELIKLSEGEAIDKISKRLKGIMSAAAERFDLALAMSGGWDSRVILAASKDIKGKVCLYNGKRPEMSKKHPDIVIPKRLARKLNLEYHYVPQSNDIDEEFCEIYERNAPYAFRQILLGLQAELKHFKQQKIGVTGNILEVARDFNYFSNPDEHKRSAEHFAEIIKMKDSPFAVEAFENWLYSANELYNLSIYELFYWEQRCGRWLSNNCLEFSMAWKEVLFPFNCRNLLIDLLSIPEADRLPPDCQFFSKLINNMWPELLSEPINPHKKPRLISKIKKKLKQIAQISKPFTFRREPQPDQLPVPICQNPCHSCAFRSGCTGGAT